MSLRLTIVFTIGSLGLFLTLLGCPDAQVSQNESPVEQKEKSTSATGLEPEASTTRDVPVAEVSSAVADGQQDGTEASTPETVEPTPLDTEEMEVAVPQEEVPDPISMKEALKSIGRKLILDEAALTTTVSNLGSAQEVTTRLERMFGQLKVLNRIPEKPDLKGLRKSLRQYTKEMGMKVHALQLKEGPSAVGGIPSNLVGNTKIHYLPGQIRGEVEIGFELTPLNIDLLETWLKRLPAGVDRMVFIESIRTREGRFVLVGKGFWFLPTVYPEHFPEMTSFLGYLREEGLTASMSEMKEEMGAKVWDRYREKVTALKKHEGPAALTLTEYARANHMEARWKFFEETALKIESRGLTELFE